MFKKTERMLRLVADYRAFCEDKMPMNSTVARETAELDSSELEYVSAAKAVLNTENILEEIKNKKMH